MILWKEAPGLKQWHRGGSSPIASSSWGARSASGNTLRTAPRTAPHERWLIVHLRLLSCVPVCVTVSSSGSDCALCCWARAHDRHAHTKQPNTMEVQQSVISTHAVYRSATTLLLTPLGTGKEYRRHLYSLVLATSIVVGNRLLTCTLFYLHIYINIYINQRHLELTLPNYSTNFEQHLIIDLYKVIYSFRRKVIFRFVEYFPILNSKKNQWVQLFVFTESSNSLNLN